MPPPRRPRPLADRAPRRRLLRPHLLLLARARQGGGQRTRVGKGPKKLEKKMWQFAYFLNIFFREDYLQTWWTLAGMAAMMAGQVEMIIVNMSSKMHRKCQSCFPSHHRLSLVSSPRSSWEGSSSSCTSLTSRRNIWYNFKLFLIQKRGKNLQMF